MCKTQLPQTLVEAVRLFSDEQTAFEFARDLRWPDGVKCPFCQSAEHNFVSTRRIWKCKGCGKQFSVKKGSIFEDSPLSFDKWLIAIWLIANAKNGISSYELHRSLGITQKSAWFMLHRIRVAMQNGSLEKLDGEIEVDETFIGGRIGNMHRGKRPAHSSGSAKGVNRGGGMDNKVAVLGILERGGEVRTQVIRDVKRRTLAPEIHANVEPGAAVYTDSLQSYRTLGQTFHHESVDHSVEFVSGNAHTNGLENFWSQVKRTIRGTYVSVEPVHLQAYMDEAAFRFNNRKVKDANRFDTAVGSVDGKRLTYKQLTGKEVAAA
jgi:transposase-like protein